MPLFSWRSKEKLATCDNRLQSLFNLVIEDYDCTIICGLRTQEEQAEAFRLGNSMKEWPDSKHNTREGGVSLAVDVAPYHATPPHIDWNDRDSFHLFAGYVIGTAGSMGIKLRWGGNWRRDFDVRANEFDDLVHFEVV